MPGAGAGFPAGAAGHGAGVGVEGLRGRYPLVAAVALLGLCPYVVLSTVLFPLQQVLATDLHASPTGLQLAAGLSNAAYAVGAVSAAQAAQRFGQRRLFLGYQAAFVVGSLLAATATGVTPWFVGRLLQGAAAGGMLISALPPLITRFGVRRLPLTVVIVDVGLFGAITLGPMLGGEVAVADSWRWLMLGVAAVAMLGWLVALVAYPELDPLDPDLRLDRAALGLAVVATVGTFFATSRLSGSSLTDPVVLAPLGLGLAALVALLVVERRKPDALIPVSKLATQLPVTGTLVAMVGGAVFVTLFELTQTWLADVGKEAPDTAGWLFWPMPLGLAVAAVAFGLLFRTRLVPVLADAGLLALVGAAALLVGLAPGRSAWVVPLAALLLGFGAGATVSPGLFMTGLGMPSTVLGRAFALVQLLRSVVTFAVGPVVVHLATSGSSVDDGVRRGILSMLVLAGGCLLAAVAVPALSGARLRTPDLERWLDGGQALPSPATAVHLRPGVSDDDAKPLVPRRRR
jgi:MFS family permease